MVKTPKTYKVLPFYDKLLDAFLAIYDRNSLTEELIKKNFNWNDIKNLPYLNLNQLIEYILNDLNNSNDSISKLALNLNDPRVVSIKKIYISNTHQTQRKELTIRLSEKTKTQIVTLSSKTSTLGEVLEIALAYHLSQCDKHVYDIIYFYFKNNL